MAHELEFVNGTASMAYAGQTPWHSLGRSVPHDLSPEQMLEAAQLDWSVEKVPLFADWNGEKVPTGRSALMRDRDGKMLDVISDGWEPIQNAEAFGFFHDFIMEGDMEMNTAGSLRDGKMVWALAKIKGGEFDACKGDTVEEYLLFANPHQYGKSVEIRHTSIRVVCNNTLTMALSKSAANMIRLNHSKKFNADMVKETLGYSKKLTQEYHEKAKFLATAKCTQEQISDYLNKLFPIGEGALRPDREFSNPGKKIFEVIETQPGAELAPGTFWNLFNAVTYATDHVLGNSADTRLSSSWFGKYQTKKIEALQLAVEMA